MSVQTYTYAIPDNLPAPVTYGTGIQGFQDVTGEWWVAKNGVSSGNWKKARDVLHAKYTRGTALPMVASPGAVIAFDTNVRDNYGMYLGSPWYGFQVPFAGWYEVLANLQVTVAVANTFIQGQIQQNTGPSNGTVVNWTSDNNFSARASGGLLWRSSALMYLTALDIVNLKAWQTQLYSITAGATVTWLAIDYMGSG